VRVSCTVTVVLPHARQRAGIRREANQARDSMGLFTGDSIAKRGRI
jgi:hypothetical protein